VVLTRRLGAHWLQILAHVGALLPLAWLAWDYTHGQLTADPVREIELRTGRYALILLVLSLSCTPVYIVSGLSRVLKLRRPLGLYAFLYASLHLLTFVGLDYGFSLSLIAPEFAQKRFLQVGLLAFLLLVPLALTSTGAWARRMGQNWKRLHRLAYLAALVVIVHFLWLVKGDLRRPLLYGALVIALLGVRIPAVRTAIVALRARLTGED
jgi:sulfoxide reductase heme-binding subunit YedZ